MWQPPHVPPPENPLQFARIDSGPWPLPRWPIKGGRPRPVGWHGRPPWTLSSPWRPKWTRSEAERLDGTWALWDVERARAAAPVSAVEARLDSDEAGRASRLTLAELQRASAIGGAWRGGPPMVALPQSASIAALVAASSSQPALAPAISAGVVAHRVGAPPVCVALSDAA